MIPSPSNDPLIPTPAMLSTSMSGHYGLFEAIRYKRHRQAMLLAEAGVDVDCRNERGQTPLIYSVVAVDDCARSRAKLVKLFLEAGADPNAADWKGLTALMHAARLGQAETVKPLLECVWTNPCLTDPNGNTALMFAASHGHHEVISVFLSVFRNNLKSLQLHRRNTDGFTALHLAARNRHEACARLLTREGQFFPTAIEVFPDPSDLDREPTPDRPATSSRSTGTMTVLEEPSDPISAFRLSVLECSVGDLPAWNYTHPFGLQTTKSTQVVSVGMEQLPEESVDAVSKETEDVLETEKIDDWPTIPMNLKTVPQKLLQPLMPIDIPVNPPPVTHPTTNTFQRKCLLKQNHRGMSGLRIKIHEQKAEKDIISGASIKSVQLKRTKQPLAVSNDNESTCPVSSLLPLIPCKDSASLPPVRYSLRRSASSKKDSMCFPSAPMISVRADQSAREMDMFKNIAALS